MVANSVTDLILEGEQRPYHAAAIAAAKRHGVTVTVTDFGYLRPDWIVLERDGMGGASQFPKSPESVHRLAAHFPKPDLSVVYPSSFARLVMWDFLYHLLSLLLRAAYPRYRPHHINPPLLNHAFGGLRMLRAGREERRARQKLAALRAEGSAYWVLPMQMETDFSIRSYSRFASMTQVIREVVQSFAARAPLNHHLLIKVHPLDPHLVNWRQVVTSVAAEFGVASRVAYVDGGDLAEMFTGAQGVVTVNSTSGISALKNGIPTKALGQAIYDILGLTYAGPLDEFWLAAEPPDRGLLKAFLGALAGAVHIRGDFFREPGLSAAVAAAAARLGRAESSRLNALIAEAKTGQAMGQRKAPTA